MLTSELHIIVLDHVRSSAVTKSAHVQYTAQKCFRLREKMLHSASHCREESQSLSLVLNRQYRLVNHLAKGNDHADYKTEHNQLLKLAREQYQQTGLTQEHLSRVASGMALAADRLLFALLKVQHYQWRDRLYVALLTEQQNEILTDERECTLGLWIHGEGLRRFRTLPGFRELDSCHHLVHQTSENLFRRKLETFTAGELKRVLHDVEETSQQLIIALDRLDERVGLLYPQPDAI
ncbi:hypothetical protein C3432_07760 [Citrobacter amalonaticus]|uniref:Chemoreceptor zinc-binding domain-containing protein n=1 Tax=Citrobacter amalonaticus TaxID=35703 RepID=A0A2S4RY61_CITAM|nr:CZB domain-containing protein [Citrobacter amalonaticus]POT57829.1 hypothetical protein C3432_07760 [Citrobacter amalonaticus]POT76644.1 hypothetical protein C3436_04065 [Citrobacter amalonaticus]POU65723.1 hypothetical protein C3430_10480 [Citrobacter amalonaticus]POV05880.1 hypothetical protein C3424_11365 [Citrobacter amalonaticus]